MAANTSGMSRTDKAPSLNHIQQSPDMTINLDLIYDAHHKSWLHPRTTVGNTLLIVVSYH